MIPFSPQQQKLWRVFSDNPNRDLGIAYLHSVVYDNTHSYSTRWMQQRLGPPIRMINRKLPDNMRIEPGQLKQTYRLNTNASV